MRTVPSGPTCTRGKYSGTGVKLRRTEMFSTPWSPPAAPPGASLNGMMPNAKLRVSRATMRLGRCTMKSGSGSSRCSRANESTA